MQSRYSPAPLRFTSSTLVFILCLVAAGSALAAVGDTERVSVDSNGAQATGGYLYGTAFPTMAGNTVLTAHVWNADNTPGPFAHLDELQYGDHFNINAWGQTYTYEVRSTSLYSPNSLRPLRHEESDWVTLITCADFNEASGQYTYRRAVQAVLISVDS